MRSPITPSYIAMNAEIFDGVPVIAGEEIHMSAQIRRTARVGSWRRIQVAEAVWAATTAPALASVVVRAYGLGWVVIVMGSTVGVLAAAYAVATLDADRREVAKVTNVLGRAAGGDLTVDIEQGRPATTELARSAASLLGLLRETVGLLTRGSAELFSGARELRDVSDTMSSTAEVTATRASAVSVAASQVAASAERVAAATEEFDATTRDVAIHAAEASTVARDASHQADLTNTTVTELGDASQRVDRIVDLIGNIARQTHLLALNATLEAARAGEAGRGFAVVAGEVKQLAEQTAAATESVSATVRTMQNGASDAVHAISAITGTIGRVSETQESIAAAVEQQTMSTNEIGRGAAEAAQGAAEIAENIAALAEAARTTAYAGAHSRTTAAEFAALADSFRAVTDRYQLDAHMVDTSAVAAGSVVASVAVVTGGTTVVANTVRGDGLHEFEYRGEWRHSSGNMETNGTNSYSCSPGDVAVLRFRGSKASFFGVMDSNHGLVGLSVDGAQETVVDEYAPSRTANVPLWASQALTPGDHTLTIRVVGERNPMSRYIWAAIERVEISA